MREIISKILILMVVFNTHVWAQQKLSYNEGLAIKKTDLKAGKNYYGFVDKSEKFKIKPIYDSVISGFRDGFAIVKIDKKLGVINKQGKTIVPFEFCDISRPFTIKLIPVKNKTGLWGFYSVKGKTITDCEYNNFRFKDKGIVIVQKQGLWGVIDSKGSILLPHTYRQLEISNDNRHYQAVRYNQWELKDELNKKYSEHSFDSLAPAGVGLLKYHMLGKYGLIDPDGNRITGYDYDSIGTEQFGKFTVKVWDKYGVISRDGKKILQEKYDQIIIDSLGFRAAIKSKEGKLWWGLFDNDGKQILPTAYHFVGEQGDGLIPIKAENGLWRYSDFSGNTIIPYHFTEVTAFKHRVAEVKDHLTNENIVIDEKGNTVIPANEFDLYKEGIVWLGKDNNKIWKISRNYYDELEVLNKDYIRAKKNGKYGLVNMDDKLVVPCKYDYVAEPSKEGYIIVTVGKKWGVLDNSGKTLLAPTDRYQKIFDFHEGMAKVMEKGKLGFIDARGNTYISPQYPEAGYFSEGMAAVKINNKWGFVDKDEKLLVQPYYDQVWPFQNGTAVVYSNGKYNLINKNGKELHEAVDKIKFASDTKYLLLNKGKVGLASQKGEEILPIKYDQIKEVKGNKLIVNLRGLYGVLDFDNNILIPITYNSIKYDPFNNLFICGSEKGFEEIKVEK